MTESLLLYMNLRSKQIVRVLAGIGPFRCLFLIGIAILWLYHNSKKVKKDQIKSFKFSLKSLTL